VFIVNGGKDVAFVAEPLNRLANLILRRNALACLDDHGNMQAVTLLTVDGDGAKNLQI